MLLFSHAGSVNTASADKVSDSFHVYYHYLLLIYVIV